MVNLTDKCFFFLFFFLLAVKTVSVCSNQFLVIGHGKNLIAQITLDIPGTFAGW